jgi:hypothetical protein
LSTLVCQARGRAGADRELRHEKPDGEQGAGACGRGEQRGEPLHWYWNCHVCCNQGNRERNGPDERAARHAGQRTSYSPAPGVDEELQADDGEGEGNDVGCDCGEGRRKRRALAVGHGDQRDAEIPVLANEAFSARKVLSAGGAP